MLVPNPVWLVALLAVLLSYLVYFVISAIGVPILSDYALVLVVLLPLFIVWVFGHKSKWPPKRMRAGLLAAAALMIASLIVSLAAAILFLGVSFGVLEVPPLL
jgi:putative flippase GtrA